MIVNLAVEGASDTGAARRVVQVAGHDVGLVLPAGGKTRLDPKIPKYNEASRQMPWVVFRDSDSLCPVELRAKLTGTIRQWQPGFQLRIAHSMTEAWLMADRDGFADYFKVSRDRVSNDPESLPHGKDELLRLCASSASRDIREEVVATDGGPGPLFVDHLNEFAEKRWDVIGASEYSDSLRRSVDRLRTLSA